MGRKKIEKGKHKTFDDWYKENKDQLNEKKRQKYKKDKEYRESIRSLSNEKYKKTKRIISDIYRITYWNGVSHVAVKVSVAAKILNVNLNTLRSYFDKGYIPIFLPDVDKGLRVVTVDQLELLKKYIKRIAETSLAVAYKEMYSELLDNWENNSGSKKIINKEERK